jgi:hypothetical protein
MSMSLRATLRSPQITSGRLAACASAAHVSMPSRKPILAGKSLPPLGTYIEAKLISPAAVGTVALQTRCSKSKTGWTIEGPIGANVFANSSATPE